MSTRIDITGATPAALHLGAGLSESARSPMGHVRGERVQAASPLPSVLGDAAEEIAMLFAEKAERRRHEERPVKASARPTSLTSEQIQAYLSQAHQDADPQRLARLAQHILADGARNLYALAMRDPLFQQPTEQFLLFQFTRDQAAAGGVPDETLQRLDTALADLHTLLGDRIQTHLLTIEPASAYAQAPHEVQRFQGSLQAVLDMPSLQRALQEVLALSGPAGQRLDTAIEHLMRGLGACLGNGLTREERLLETVVSDLFHLKALNTALEGCRALVARLRRHTGPDRPGRKPGQRPTPQTDADPVHAHP